MHGQGEPVKLTRDCEVTVIPQGDKISLKAGSEVQVTQTLGGAFTVTTDQGYMVRIEGKDADVIGQKPPPTPEAPTLDGSGDVEKAVWDQMRTVFDPEIPVNIVELGLVYECKLTDVEDGKNVSIKMSMTAPGCGMGDTLRTDAEEKIRSVPGIKEVNVEIVWEPAWDPSRMSEAARLQLGMM